MGSRPAKNEALSMLGPGHSHAPRVRILLAAAQRTMITSGFVPFAAADSLGMELIVYAPAGKDPWDATNYLGGVGDVLERKDRRGRLDHLGDLRNVHLYSNDRQIHEVHYRLEPADRPHYRVRLWQRGR